MPSSPPLPVIPPHVDEGRGTPVILLHPGLDDGSTWAPVSALLAARVRSLRVHRRPYRQDVPEPVSIAEEVGEVVALAVSVGGGVILVGHSSGGVVALEALVARPDLFVGAVLYEPPLVIGPPLGGAAYLLAKAAIDAGRPGFAMRIFLRDVVKVPAWLAWVAGVFVGLVPRMRALAPRQVGEVAAIDTIGCRLDAYAAIGIPVVLLGGDRSPRHLADRLDALQRVLPRVERVTLRGMGHDANRRAPAEVARVILDFEARLCHATV